MVYQKKTNRQEHPPEVISVIWALHCIRYSALKIRLKNGLPKSTIISIIRRVRNHPSDPFRKAIRTGRPPKLDARAKRRLVWFMANHPFEIIISLSTPSKLGYRMHINTTRRYLTKNHYYAFRPRKKPYLRPHHKTVRLRWARIYKDLELSDWALVGFSDELTFELGINTSPPWARRKIGEACESKNLKPTFKLGRSSGGIWGEISLEFKGGFVILKKGASINSHRHINKILTPHAAPFYAKRTLKYGDAVFMQELGTIRQRLPYSTSKILKCRCSLGLHSRPI